MAKVTNKAIIQLAAISGVSLLMLVKRFFQTEAESEAEVEAAKKLHSGIVELATAFVDDLA